MENTFAGRCPLLPATLSFSVIEYSINTSNVITALVKCNNTNYYEIECDINGLWDIDFIEKCASSLSTEFLVGKSWYKVFRLLNYVNFFR